MLAGFALSALFTGEVQAAFLSTTTTSAQTAIAGTRRISPSGTLRLFERSRRVSQVSGSWKV